MTQNADSTTPLIYQDGDAFYEEEMKRAANIVRNLVRERDELRLSCARLIVAAGGRIEVPGRLLMHDRYEWWRERLVEKDGYILGAREL